MFRPGHSAAALSLHQHVLPKNPQGLASSRATLAAPQQTLDAMDCHLAWVSLVQSCSRNTFDQWEFQDPKMEVLYHIRPYFVGIFPYIGLI